MNISLCRYSIVPDTAVKKLNWKVTKSEAENWLIKWADSPIDKLEFKNY
jgi:hypothetical protein